MITRTRFFILIFTLVTGLSTLAQVKPVSFGVYGEGLFRADNSKEQVKNGFGGGLDFQFKLPVKLAITASAGYVHFGEKTLSATTKIPEINIAAVRTGLKYRVNLLYLKMESGAAIPFEEGNTTVILSPGLGIRLSAIDLQGKYEIWLDKTNQYFYGLKLGIHF